MGNELTKQQLRNWLDKSVKEAKNPDPRKLMREERKKKRKQIAKGYGLKS